MESCKGWEVALNRWREEEVEVWYTDEVKINSKGKWKKCIRKQGGSRKGK